MSELRARCFVIMPFSKSSDSHTEEYWTNHFTNFLKPLIEEIPYLEASRVKSLRGHILKQIITDLVVSPIVVAELTDHNPNVFWELGVRQSFKKLVKWFVQYSSVCESLLLENGIITKQRARSSDILSSSIKYYIKFKFLILLTLELKLSMIR